MKDRRRPGSRESDGSRLLIKGCHVWTANGPREASILVIDGKIARIARTTPDNGSEILSANGKLALPGLIDTHVHLRDMELSYKETFRTGTEAAAAGGFTTVLDMPNTKPPTDSPLRLKEKIARAKEQIVTNIGFHAAAILNDEKIRDMRDLGVFSLKLYMPRPISPIDLDDDGTLLKFFRTAKLASLPVTVHAEDPDLIETGEQDRATPMTLATGRPERAETSAVQRVLDIVSRTKTQVHFCHLTLPSSIRSIRRAGPLVTSEVTPHHMLLSEQTLKRNGWKAWMVPPLRDQKVRSELFRLVSRGQVDIIASDHAPHTIREKKSSSVMPPPGIPGLETTLPLMLTLVNKGSLLVQSLVRMCSARPAQTFGLNQKGRLEEGFDADIVIVDLKKRGRVRPDRFFSKAKYSPFEGMMTQGKIVTTIVNGEIVFDHDDIVSRAGTTGKILARDRQI